MRKTLLFASIFFANGLLNAQITIDHADYGTVGDSFVIATDMDGNGISVGTTGSTSWDFSNLQADDINTYKFEDPNNTVSGFIFPASNIAIQRLEDTLFFNSTSSVLELVGMAGNVFTEVTGGAANINLAVKLNPPVTQVNFPSTFNDTFTDVAYIDTIVSCAAVGVALCDSARLRRKTFVFSEMDAHGPLQTPSDNYASTLRQYYRQTNHDTIDVKMPFIGWQEAFYDSITVVHTYRWFANGEDWPVVTANTDVQNGNMLFTEFKIGSMVVGQTGTVTSATCFGECDGSASVNGLGGSGSYTYAWDANANNQTTATATGLCAGTYDVTISDGTTSDVVTVTITEPQEIEITAAMQGISSGDGAIDITVAGGSGPYSYSWTGPGGFTATTADIADLDSIGSYTVNVSDVEGCTASETFTLTTTGVSGIRAGQSIRIYPNPVKNTVTITSPQQIVTVSVMNILGETVMKMPVGGNTSTISMGTLAPGTYFVQAGDHAPMRVVKK